MQQKRCNFVQMKGLHGMNLNIELQKNNSFFVQMPIFLLTLSTKISDCGII